MTDQIGDNEKKFLLELFRQTKGSMSAKASMYDVGAAIGLDKPEAKRMAEEMMALNLIEVRTLSGGIAITGDGLEKAEKFNAASGSDTELSQVNKEDNMKCKAIQTSQAPAAIGPYSQAIAAGYLLFVSGQLGLNPQTGEFAGQDLASQARQALENLKQIVIAGGSAPDQVISVDVFLTDIGKFSEFNEIYKEYFSVHRPARAVVGVNALPKGACIEIKCIAAL